MTCFRKLFNISNIHANLIKRWRHSGQKNDFSKKKEQWRIFGAKITLYFKITAFDHQKEVNNILLIRRQLVTAQDQILTAYLYAADILSSDHSGDCDKTKNKDSSSR